MSEYVSVYKPKKDALEGFERYRKFKRFVKLFNIDLHEVAELTGHKYQTVKCWHSGSVKLQITTENLTLVFTHFGGVNDDGEPNYQPLRDL